MLINESSATALVRFTGLGLCSFESAKEHGDISIIRDGRHDLAIKIQKPNFIDGTDEDVLSYVNIANYQNLDTQNVRIEINSGDNSAKPGVEIYETEGEFNRLKSEDTNDFRWIVDMDKLHSNKLSRIKTPAQHPITQLSVNSGLFYTHKLDTDMLFEKVTKDADGNEEERETFGHVGETIGIKLDTEAVEFKIKIGEEEKSHVLEKVEGLPYKIEISNIDYNEDAVMSEMFEYYKYLKSQSGRTFELEPVKEDKDGEMISGGSVNEFTFCHPGKGGGGCSC